MAIREKNADTVSGKEKLILAGIEEIRKDGVKDFSLRKVAKRCNVSSAAPYKHFDNKQDFIIATIEYINKQWYARQERIKREYENDTRRQLLEISIDYIRFLVENPHFRSIIMLREEGLLPEQIKIKSQMSALARNLIVQYCEETHMPDDERIARTFVVRALLYGASLLFDNGEAKYNEDMLCYIARTIERELDLD